MKKRKDIKWFVYGQKLTLPQDLEAPYTFIHFPSDEELAKLYSSADVVICPSWYESFPAPPLEAMACGTPVIVSTGCGASEVLTDGESALLVPPKSPEKISDAIIKLKENPNLWRRLSTNGRKFVEENIRWDLYTKNMLRVFEEVLRNK